MRWIFHIIGLLGVIIGLAIGGLLLLPAERLAKIASDRLSQQLGRSVVVEGEVGLAFWPSLSIATGPLRVGNDPGFGPTPLLTAEAAQLGMNTAALFRGIVEIEQVIIQSPVIALEQDTAGRNNWTFEAATASPSNDPSPSAQTADTQNGADAAQAATQVAIQRVTIDGGAMSFTGPDGAFSVDNLDLDLRWPDPDGPAEIQMTLAMSGTPVEVSATVSDPLHLMAGGSDAITLQITAAGGKAAFSGRASTAPRMDGTTTLSLDDTAAFLRALGQPAETLPFGFGQALSLAATLTATPDQIGLRDLSLKADHHALAGDLSLDLTSPRPFLRGALTSGPLDFDRRPGGATGNVSPNTTGTRATDNATRQSARQDSWSHTPIDASALSLLDADITIAAPSVRLNGLHFEQTRVALTIDRARAVAQMQNLSGYGGGITGQFVVNNRSGLSMGGALQAREVAIGPLLRDLDITDRITGTGSVDLSFLAVGETEDQLIRSLSGDGSLAFGRGTITGIDLDQLMQTGTGRGGTTIFDRLDARFTLQGGVLRNDDLVAELPQFRTTGAGEVDLGGRRIDYTFTPNVLAARDGRGAAIPITLRGAWDDVEIDADLIAGARITYEAEIEAAEDQLREEVNERLQDAIGLTVEENQTLEDALEQRLQEEISNGLRSLFGGNN